MNRQSERCAPLVVVNNRRAAIDSGFARDCPPEMGCIYLQISLCIPVFVSYLLSRGYGKWSPRAIQPTPLCAGSAAGFAEILDTPESGTRERTRGRWPQCTFVKELRVCCHLPPRRS